MDLLGVFLLSEDLYLLWMEVDRLGGWTCLFLWSNMLGCDLSDFLAVVGEVEDMFVVVDSFDFGKSY